MFDAKMVVLVVTEDSIIRDTVLLTLSRKGCLVQGANSVSTARQIVSSEAPDAVLLDVDSDHPQLEGFIDTLLSDRVRLVITGSARKLFKRSKRIESLPKPFGPTDVLRVFGLNAK